MAEVASTAGCSRRPRCRSPPPPASEQPRPERAARRPAGGAAGSMREESSRGSVVARWSTGCRRWPESRPSWPVKEQCPACDRWGLSCERRPLLPACGIAVQFVSWRSSSRQPTPSTSRRPHGRRACAARWTAGSRAACPHLGRASRRRRARPGRCETSGTRGSSPSSSAPSHCELGSSPIVRRRRSRATATVAPWSVRRRSPLSYGSGRHRGGAGARERLRRDGTAAASSASGLRTATRHRLGRLGDRAATAPPAPRFAPAGGGR